jgi:REP element-mobilizing transposase RayT
VRISTLKWVIARGIRIEYPGAFYRVMARGNRRDRIFRDGEGRRFFIRAPAEVGERTGWRVRAWVLMSNHYHLMVETPEANLVEGMTWLQNTSMRQFNSRAQAEAEKPSPISQDILTDPFSIDGAAVFELEEKSNKNRLLNGLLV